MLSGLRYRGSGECLARADCQQLYRADSAKHIISYNNVRERYVACVGHYEFVGYHTTDTPFYPSWSDIGVEAHNQLLQVDCGCCSEVIARICVDCIAAFGYCGPYVGMLSRQRWGKDSKRLALACFKKRDGSHIAEHAVAYHNIGKRSVACVRYHEIEPYLRSQGY